MRTKSIIISAIAVFAIFSLSACDAFSSADETTSEQDKADVTGSISYAAAELHGTWVQVAGNLSLVDRDTFTFSANEITGNTQRFKISTLAKCASNGQIWEKFGSAKLYRYAYKIEGDTLWMLEENDTELSFNKTWSIGFVKAGTDTEGPAVDSAAFGHWTSSYSTNPAYYTIAENTFTYDKVIDGDTAYHVVYADSGVLRMNRGLISVVSATDTEYVATYKVIGDSLALNYCSSFCTALDESAWKSGTVEKYWRKSVATTDTTTAE